MTIPAPLKQTDANTVIGYLADQARRQERHGADPTQWIYVGSGAPAPDFQNGFDNVGGARVPMRYRFLRPTDPFADPTVNANQIEIQGSVTGGAPGEVIFQLLEPFYYPDDTPAPGPFWQPITRDFDVHLAASDDTGGFVVMTVLQTGEVVYGFV